jgi:ABC-type multidrug transport system ATPase subunit
MSEKWETFVLGRYGVKKISGEIVLDDGDEGKAFALDDDIELESETIKRDFDKLKFSVPMLFKEVWKIYLPPNNGLMSLISSALRLKKDFIPPKRAVRGVTTAVHLDETFVLLGKNGCGKSTSIGMLTGDILPTKGCVYVAGKNVSHVDSDSGTVGFCPQTDPLIESLTGRETLRLFARIRGIPGQLIDAEVDRLLDVLNLTPHADKATETYSGGNKRKLSLGIAMIGDPKVLIIDEPTCGVDPSSQRKIWNLVAAFAIGRSVLLTTHSMEEAQALSTRTAIMADGKLLCLGSIQHLKVPIWICIL